MAFSVNKIQEDKSDLKIVRGDTFVYPFIIKNSLELKYIPNPSDTIMFYVYNKFTDTKPLFEKKIPYDNLYIILSAKETSSMRYGNYVYVVKIKYSSGFVDTIVTGNFSIVVPGGE